MTPDEVQVLTQSIVDNAKRLGLIWTLRPGTITSIFPNSMVRLDGDDEISIPCDSMVGTLQVGVRVYVLQVPPSGNYVVGFTGDSSRMDSDEIATSQSTPSLTYTNLATVGPTVEAIVGSSGKALITVTAFIFNGTLGAVSSMAYDVAGATTIAASDDRALIWHSQIANGQGRMSMQHLQKNLNPGLHTFTAKYRVNAGSGTFVNRTLTVVTQ